VTPGFVLSCELPLQGQLVSLEDTSTPSPLHYGFTITKKVGNAVKRNRIRRRLRHMVHSLATELELTGWSCVFLARGDAFTRPYDDLTRDFRWAIRKLREQHQNAHNTAQNPVS
jgi:ribonuclease P protein component